MTIELLAGETTVLDVALVRSQPQTVKLYSSLGWRKPSIDAWLHRSGTRLTWTDIHDGAGTGCDCGYTNTPASWSCSGGANRFSHLNRGKVTHNFSPIPVNSTILSVSYSFVLSSKFRYSTLPLSLALYELPMSDFTTCNLQDYQRCGSTPISNVFMWPELIAGQRYSFTILASYLPLFVAGQKSAFSVREATYDGPNIQPPFQYYEKAGFLIAAIDDFRPHTDPYLEVTYQQ